MTGRGGRGHISKIRILLVDDHQLFREGIATILSAQPDLAVIGEAADGTEAIVKARLLKPDLILMDVSMPGTDGVEATAAILQEHPDIIVVMLTVRDDDESLFRAISCGAQGYLLKTTPSTVLLDLLRRATKGEAAITPALAGRLLEEFRRLGNIDPAPDDAAEEESLTNREKEVLTLVAQGKTDQEVAEALTISIHTAKSHMRNILAKLHKQHRQEAARYALRRNMIPPPPDHT